MNRLEVIEQVITCTRCELSAQCSGPVPLRGDPSPIAIVGEAPGETEDQTGKPFVGPAGHLLDEILDECGITGPFGVLNSVSCLGRYTKVFLGDGTTEGIGKLVVDRYDGEVVCVDSGGHLVTRRVVGWHRNLIAGRRMYRVTHEYSRGTSHGPVGFDATGDHEVLTERGWTRVGDLKDGDRIHTGMIGLSASAEQVVLSGLLGDATVDSGAPARMEFCSGRDEVRYIAAKHAMFQGLNALTSRGRGWPRVFDMGRDRGPGDGPRFCITHPTVRLYSRCSSAMLVTLLDDFGLALWYMDDGHFRQRRGRQPDAQISIARMSPVEAEDVAEAIRAKGIPVWMKISSMGPRLMFGVEGTKVLLSRIGRFIHADHERKAPGMERCSWPTTPAPPLWARVHVVPIRAESTVYCLSVEEHQNFVTVGGVVHNCWPHGTPTWDHIQACRPNVDAQLDYLDPTWVLLLGRVALAGFRPDIPLRRGRGRPFLDRKRICFATYHPAAALRNGSYRDCMRGDLEVFAELLDVGLDNWMRFIPDSCAACPNPAEWFEHSGIGWCPIHIPASLRPAYDANQTRNAAEIDAARQRDTALAAVAVNADPQWMAVAFDTLVQWLRTHQTFFCDEIWDAGLDEPRESRALGAVIQRAAREGLMCKSGEFRKSVRSNLSEKPTWTSLIYGRAP